jgi:hypothetical protein
MTILDIIRLPAYYLKHDVSEMDSIFLFRRNLLSWVQ